MKTEAEKVAREVAWKSSRWSAVFYWGRERADGLKTQKGLRNRKSSSGQSKDLIRSRRQRGRPGGHGGIRSSEFRVLGAEDW